MTTLTFHPPSALNPTRTARHVRPPQCKLGARTLGVDYGLRRIGLAVSVGIAPRALPPIHHTNSLETTAREIISVAEATLSHHILVGLPLDPNGDESKQSLETRSFIYKLIQLAPWATVCGLDERYSTMEAVTRLNQSGVHGAMQKNFVDSAAAVVLLERAFSGREVVEVFHKGVAVKEGRRERSGEKIVGFREWKKNVMEKAKRDSEELGKTQR